MNKRFLIITILTIFHQFVNAQNVDSLIIYGIELRNSGNYIQAIEKFKEALAIDRNSPTLNYEIAYTYLVKKDFRKTIKICNRLIKSESPKSVDAYILKGSALDYSGRRNRSIKFYKNAIKKHPDNYLLHFNLGINYHNKNQFHLAQNEYLKAIESNNLHPSSHFMLGYVMNDQGKRVEGMLSLYFFLLLEPNTDRSAEAYQLLNNLWLQNVEITNNDTSSIKIYTNPKSDHEEFNSIDLRVSTIKADSYKHSNKGLNKHEQFIRNTAEFFKVLDSFKGFDNKTIWWNLHIPLFKYIDDSNLVEPFCYYISLTCDDEYVNGWHVMNRDQIEVFSNMLNNYLQDNASNK
ncbi:MAG: tetratricopeptide repeat protein [Tenuifilaceae bacterium]